MYIDTLPLVVWTLLVTTTNVSNRFSKKILPSVDNKWICDITKIIQSQIVETLILSFTGSDTKPIWNRIRNKTRSIFLKFRRRLFWLSSKRIDTNITII